ncbi:MAG: universal stress protein [Saprospiraceae bacterium]
MKNIFVPTDFSACAAHATHAAIELAAAYRATLHLYTALNPRTKFTKTDNDQNSESEELAQEIKNKELLLKKWEEIAKDKNAIIKTGLVQEDLLHFIESFIPENNVDFIVMGSHGASGKNEYILGSNTQKVVRLVQTPVLIIKEKLKDYKIRNVVFASNYNLSEKRSFKYLLDFVKVFKPTIHLVQINTSSWFGESYIVVKSAMDDFRKMAEDKGMTCKTHFKRDWTIDAGVRHLSKELGADLIAISNDQRHPLKRLFIGSNVEALVNHAETPVLAIDFPED